MGYTDYEREMKTKSTNPSLERGFILTVPRQLPRSQGNIKSKHNLYLSIPGWFLKILGINADCPLQKVTIRNREAKPQLEI